MEKHITRWAYWLGSACLAIALVWRVLNLFRPTETLRGLDPLSFMKGALLFFVAAIATANYAWMKSQRPYVDLKDKKTLPALQTALEDDVPEVSFAVAKALWTLNDPKGHDALIDVLSGETKTSSGFLTKQKREALRMLHTPKPMFLFAIKQGAAFAPVPGLGAGISSLQGILSDPSVSGRATTALLLATDKDPRVLQALRDGLDDKEWSVRAAAVHAIALRNDTTLETDLTPLFDDKNQAVRARAAAGYLRLDWIRSTARHPTPRARTLKPKA